VEHTTYFNTRNHTTVADSAFTTCNASHKTAGTSRPSETAVITSALVSKPVTEIFTKFTLFSEKTGSQWHVLHIISRIQGWKWQTRVLVWNLVPFLPLHPFPFSFLPLLSLSSLCVPSLCLGPLFQIELRSLGALSSPPGTSRARPTRSFWWILSCRKIEQYLQSINQSINQCFIILLARM